jgi:hypothetical protein
MKYGKAIIDYKNSIKNNSYMNNSNLILNDYSIIRYKLLKQIINKIYFEEENSIYLEDDCCICLEELGKNYVTLQCDHSYHTQCFINLFKFFNKCSLCRKKFGKTLPIFNFIFVLQCNIECIEYYHNKMENIINDKIYKANCAWVTWNHDILIMQNLLKHFDNINSTGIKKILKKFKKKRNYNIDDILNYCETLNFFIK